ncbi:diacylglycerol/lipid kinase family protein [Gemmatimonadota bacterium]
MAIAEPPRVFAIFNPASDRGRGAKKIPPILELLNRHIPGLDYAVSVRSGDEGQIAEEAIRQGFDTIVAVGGDGTLSTVADRILATRPDQVRFGMLPGGTGNDFGRNIGIPKDSLEEAVRTLTVGRTVKVDVGRVIGAAVHEGRGGPPEAGRHFLNIVGFGFDIAAVDSARGARLLRGALLYKTAAFQQLFRFKGFPVDLTDNEGYHRSGQGLMIIVSNGPYFGGGYPITPRASVQDGKLHSCFIGDANPIQRLILFDRAGKGRHEGLSRVDIHTAPGFTMTFAGPVRFEIDGDVYASATGKVGVEVVPNALQVVVPQGELRAHPLPGTR